MTAADEERAAEALAGAEALVIAAGAGMGVDSGLPDFRGPQGFWRAYPPYQKLGLSFEDLANPRWFSDDPELAWGFYGHRLALYRATTPHAGFGVLERLAGRTARGWFVFTSNVDGAFQRAGFDDKRICEVHGAIDVLQCTEARCTGLWSADDVAVDVDQATFRARPPLPTCPRCGKLARPNILMFGDWGWDSSRADQQSARLQDFLRDARGARTVVVECGAGTAIPSVRRFSERLMAGGATVLRINLREPDGASIGLSSGARDALVRLATRVDALR
ncbi:MAG: NAD-dependent protein deacetylase [Deltaproteobacteria bacterium RBG_16_71_12]|nr:MAG: NAD-dependent protein deacetylase [Deltaproteobacteria bacterium RBG_16_71_12]